MDTPTPLLHAPRVDYTLQGRRERKVMLTEKPHYANKKRKEKKSGDSCTPQGLMGNVFRLIIEILRCTL